jgi:hypothetical protein
MTVHDHNIYFILFYFILFYFIFGDEIYDL